MRIIKSYGCSTAEAHCLSNLYRIPRVMCRLEPPISVSYFTVTCASAIYDAMAPLQQIAANDIVLQMALSHASYMSGFSINQDHVKNTLSNCGIRRPSFGKFSIHKEVKIKKRGKYSYLLVWFSSKRDQY